MNDYTVSAVGNSGSELAGAYLAKSTTPVFAKKYTAYLVTYKGNKSIEKFITLEKPELLNGFIGVKGFYSTLPEKEIIETYLTLLTNCKKELICEEMLPWHLVLKMRSLVFSAVKIETLKK